MGIRQDSVAGLEPGARLDQVLPHELGHELGGRLPHAGIETRVELSELRSQPDQTDPAVEQRHRLTIRVSCIQSRFASQSPCQTKLYSPVPVNPFPAWEKEKYPV